MGDIPPILFRLDCIGSHFISCGLVNSGKLYTLLKLPPNASISLWDNGFMDAVASKHYNDAWPWWMRFAGRVRRRLVSRRRGSALVLMYHRVGELPHEKDPHHLAVTPALFEAQIAAIVEAFEVLPLSEIVGRLAAGQVLPKRSVCLTFDDGYADNFSCALPILERYGAPATFFVAGAGLKAGWQYAWETNEGYEHVTVKTLARASAHPLVEIGGHTQTHPHLAQLSAEEQKREIAENKVVLEEIIGHPLRLFAYPFGGLQDFNEASVSAVAACGYSAAVTTSSGLVSRGVDCYCMPREDISEMDAESAVAFLKHAFGY